MTARGYGRSGRSSVASSSAPGSPTSTTPSPLAARDAAFDELRTWQPPATPSSFGNASVGAGSVVFANATPVQDYAPIPPAAAGVAASGISSAVGSKDGDSPGLGDRFEIVFISPIDDAAIPDTQWKLRLKRLRSDVAAAVPVSAQGATGASNPALQPSSLLRSLSQTAAAVSSPLPSYAFAGASQAQASDAVTTTAAAQSADPSAGASVPSVNPGKRQASVAAGSHVGKRPRLNDGDEVPGVDAGGRSAGVIAPDIDAGAVDMDVQHTSIPAAHHGSVGADGGASINGAPSVPGSHVSSQQRVEQRADQSLLNSRSLPSSSSQAHAHTSGKTLQAMAAAASPSNDIAEEQMLKFALEDIDFDQSGAAPVSASVFDRLVLANERSLETLSLTELQDLAVELNHFQKDAKSRALRIEPELRKLYIEDKGVRADAPAIAYCRIGERSSHSSNAIGHDGK